MVLTLTPLLPQQAYAQWHKASSATLQLKNCLCRKLTETQWRLLSVVSLVLNDDSTQASIYSQSLSTVNWFSGGLSFKIILTASAKEYCRAAGSPEEVLGWAVMAIVVQLASLTYPHTGKSPAAMNPCCRLLSPRVAYGLSNKTNRG